MPRGDNSKIEELLADILKEQKSQGGAGGAQGAAAARRGAMASGKGGTGLLGAAGGLAKKIPGLAAAATVAGGAAALGSAVGGGLVNSSRGGTFAGGATRSLLEAADKALPFGLGELAGISQTVRVGKGAESDLNRITNDVAKFAGAGAIDPGIRKAAADRALAQNKRVEADRAANSALITDKVASGDASEAGSTIAEFLAGLKAATAVLSSLTASSPKTAG